MYGIKPQQGDPYRYQVGFGNRFASEAMYVDLKCVLLLRVLTTISPGTLPSAQNNPQKAKYDLYTESVSASGSYK